MGKVPILYQHRVVPLPQWIGTWTYKARQTFLATDTLPWSFAAQLDWLEAHGYTTILPRDLAEHWDRGVPLPARCVILTFDDGYPEWVSTVLPLLDAEDDPTAHPQRRRRDHEQRALEGRTRSARLPSCRLLPRARRGSRCR